MEVLESLGGIARDLNELNVDMKTLKRVYTQKEGTRKIIQYGNDKYSFSLSKTIKPTIRCFGLTNRCSDGKFVFFADYDRVYKSLLYKNLDVLLERYPDSFDKFYIVKTGKEEYGMDGDIVGSYHVINFVKHSKSDIQEFLTFCDVDPDFVRIPNKTAHKTHVLRISEKFYEENGKVIKESPKFLEIYPSNKSNSGLECSYAHYKFFQDNWGNPTNIKHKFDKLTKVELHSYLTPQKESDK